ncbi:RNA-directed DNA polymerase (Reverse transcriptase) [Duganella sp. FT80W]|uniref:RNA-directed DNA polymerase (Reverse transcriptase) n=1 Tax=Duganella guangzhouensis TaxID=2666084 RepID=A0A6I2KXS2_9BURK|nr:RNA-directed DNA polymerase (Reverse transcriptase) [Duganella guangzhouensis]
MPSSGAATGTPRTTPACSISTTTGRTTPTTTWASADPKISYLDVRLLADGRSILGRDSPGIIIPKARQSAKPKTAAVLTSAAAERGTAPAKFAELTSLPNLYACWRQAKRSKSASLRVQRFGDDALRHLVEIQRRLRAREYTFGPYKTFTVREKKFRHVVDAPMKDRIVHWMLYQYLLPIWQPRFIHDTFGNLPNRGTHAAVDRLAQFARSPANSWALQVDISKYFYSVNHSLLKARALRYIGDQDVRALIVGLIDSFRTDDQFDALFPADGLYRRTRDKGMPIGNLSSQLFANVFLSDFDHWIKQDLRVKAYVRYVDDIVILASSRAQLLELSTAIVEKLAGDGLTLHPKKIRLAPVAAGVPFLGYIVWPNHISLGAYGRSRYHQRLRQHESGIRDRSAAIRSYHAMFSHTGTTTKKRTAA